MDEWRDTEIGLIHKDFVPYRIEGIALKMADAPFGTSIKNYDYTPEGVVVVQGNNIAGRECDWSNLRFVSNEKYTSLPRSQCFVGDLIFPKVGTIGKVGILSPYNNSDKYLLSTNTMMLRVNPALADQNFVYYYFFSERIKDYIELINPNSVQPVFNFTSLKNFPIYLPPLPEQQAIAEVLSSLDDKIELLHRQNKTLEVLAETLFRQWFVEEADESWESGTLGDVTKNVRCNIQPTNIEEEAKYIGLEHIERKHIALYSSGSSNQIASNKSVFRQNDILFGKLRPYFHKVCFAPFDGVCSTDILVLRPKESLFFPYCLFALFQKGVVDFSDLSSEGTRMPRTSWEILQQYPIAIPSKDAVLRFNEIAFPVIKKIKENIKQIHQLTTLRDTLLPKLMSGEVRVEIAEAETASASQ